MNRIEIDSNPVVVPIFEKKMNESEIRYSKSIQPEGVHQVEVITFEFVDDDYKAAVQIYDQLISELRTGAEYDTRSIFHFFRSKRLEQGLTIFVIVCALTLLVYLLMNREAKVLIWGNTVWFAVAFLIAVIIMLGRIVFISNRD